MRGRAMEGTCLAALVRMTIPIAQAAERERPRSRGRPPEYSDWQMMILILVAVLARRKSKSAQYRFLHEHRHELARLLGMTGFPARSTYFERYAGIWPLLEVAIRVQGRRLIQEGIADPSVVAVDKSPVRAKGPLWHQRDRRRGEIPKGLTGVDRDASWTSSKHHGWVHGYAYETVVSAGKRGVVVPLLASADTAAVSEHLTFRAKIAHLPAGVRYVTADRGYDNSAFDEAIELNGSGRRSARRFVCRQNRRKGGPCNQRTPSDPRQRRRHRRINFAATSRGCALLSRRRATVEPFNDWFKTLFELDHRAWHRGLGNNRTQLLAAILAYQTLVRYNHRRGRQNGQIRWILDTL